MPTNIRFNAIRGWFGFHDCLWCLFLLMVNPRLDFINLVLIPLIGYPGFPRSVVARSRGRPLGSHYGERP